MSEPSIRRWDRETALLAWVTACVSVFSFLYYFRHGDILLYGDAVAHVNIARRVFDSRTPGLLQLGTVWLPLPHLLMIPFILVDNLWRTGAGASIPSMTAFVFGTLGIFRLVRGALDFSHSDITARIAAWGAAVIYAANPNLIYLQTTAMTELLYMALFIWAVVHFSEFVWDASDRAHARAANASSSLLKCGLCLAAGCLTRYDGWMVAAVVTAIVLIMTLLWKQNGEENHRVLRRSVMKLVLLAAAGPVLWLAYNAIVYRNPLEFANGPYSAKAIELKTPGASHPGSHDLPVAFSFVLKSAELNQASGSWQRLWIVLVFAGAIVCLTGGMGSKRTSDSSQTAPRSRLWPLLLLLIPLPFYVLSVAYSGVPIFVPVWWPFSYYNVRYGLELLPAFAVFAAVTAHFVAGRSRSLPARIGIGTAMLIVVAASYASIWRTPICLEEARINSRTRMGLERELADFVKALPHDSNILMYLGDHVGALQQAGIPLRRVINEGNHRTWKQPVDSEGLWERALLNPTLYADFVIAFDGDAVSTGLQKQDLFPLAVIHVSGQPKATIYQAHRNLR
jgi:hypothetical protein